MLACVAAIVLAMLVSLWTQREDVATTFGILIAAIERSQSEQSFDSTSTGAAIDNTEELGWNGLEL